MDLKKYIGTQIKTFRKSAGFTQDELAKRLNKLLVDMKKGIGKPTKICSLNFAIFLAFQ